MKKQEKKNKKGSIQFRNRKKKKHLWVYYDLKVRHSSISLYLFLILFWSTSRACWFIKTKVSKTKPERTPNLNHSPHAPST